MVPEEQQGSFASTATFAVAALAVLVVLLKLPTLGTPAYWDEIGWLGPAHELYKGNLLHAIPGLRPAGMFWGHPPGLHVFIAMIWKVLSPSLVSAHLVIAGFAALGVSATYLLARHLYEARTGWLAALFLLLSPVYFVQAGMFLGDVPVAALSVLTVYLALTGRYRGYLVTASLMPFVKETSVAVIVAVVLYRLLSRRPLGRAAIQDALPYALPLIPIGLFFVVQKLATGELFFINTTGTELFDLSLTTAAIQGELITRWIFVDQWRIGMTLAIGLGLVLRPRLRRPELLLFLLILLLSAYPFAVMYYLPRYLMPVLPFFSLLAAASLLELIPREGWKIPGALASLAALVFGLLSQPLRGNAEFNLRYRDFIAVSQAMARRLEAEPPEAPIVTEWPLNAQFSNPFLGYVPRALKTQRFIAGMQLPPDARVVVSSSLSAITEPLREQALKQGWVSRARVTRRGADLELLTPGAGR